MANNQMLPGTGTSNLPITDESTPATGDYFDPKNELTVNPNPAMMGYYKSQARKNNAITFFLYVGLTVLGLSLGVVGYYLSSIRDPIIRLEEKVDSLKEQTKTNSDSIDNLKKYMYSHSAQSIQIPQK
jgi:hypothetical protein